MGGVTMASRYYPHIGSATFDYDPAAFGSVPPGVPVVEQLRPQPRSRMQIGPITTTPSEEEWIDALIQRAQPAAAPPPQQAGISDAALLEASVPEQEVVGAPTPAAPEMDWISQLVPPEESAAPAPEEPVPAATGASPQRYADAPLKSREQMLLASLVRPSRDDGIKAGLFDGLFGGTRYTDDVRARRNVFDQALVNAQAGDASAQERAIEAQAQAERFAQQDETTRRGQDKMEAQRIEDRNLRGQMASANNERAFRLQQMRDAAARERAQIMKHGGGGGAGGDGRAQAIAGMEEAHLARAATMFGEKPVTVEQVRLYRQDPGAATPEALGVTPEQFELLRNEDLVIKGMFASDRDKYGQIIKGGSVREAGTVDQFGKTQELRWGDPKALLNIENELTKRNAVINAASEAWQAMSDDAKRKLATIPPGNWQNIALDGEDQARVARIQALANFDIKAAAGSAVTENEWRRVANEIGLPDGLSLFRTPDALQGWILQHRKVYRRLEGNAMRHYKGLFGGGGQ